MKFFLKLLILLFTVKILAVQNTAGQDNKVPKQISSNLDSLSVFLTSRAVTDSEKVNNIFLWITDNISYDVKKWKEIKEGRNDTSQTATAVLKKRKAVCEGYANLLHELCKRSNIKSTFIGGYSRHSTTERPELHAWNAVYLNNQWKLIDATWAAGGINEKANVFTKELDRSFFLVAPEKLIVTHYPDDPMWQLKLFPVNRMQYNAGKTEAGNKTVFAFNDTIENYFLLDSSAKEETQLQRIIRYDATNPLYIKMLHNFYENAEVVKMNAGSEKGLAAVEKLNQFGKIFNSARNKRSAKILNDNESVLIDLLKQAKENTEAALVIYYSCKPQLPTDKAKLKKNMEAIKQNLISISKFEDYLKKYYTTPLNDRHKMF